MHFVELLLVLDQPIVPELDPLEQRDDARNLRGRHYLAVAVHAPQRQKLNGEQTLHHVAHEFQQHQMAEATKRAFHQLPDVHDQLPTA